MDTDVIKSHFEARSHKAGGGRDRVVMGDWVRVVRVEAGDEQEQMKSAKQFEEKILVIEKRKT